MCVNLYSSLFNPSTLFTILILYIKILDIQSDSIYLFFSPLYYLDGIKFKLTYCDSLLSI